MIRIVQGLAALCIVTGIATLSMGDQKQPAAAPALDFTVKNIEGKDVPLSAYRGKVVVIVNVASKCGYTKQYKGLEALHEKYGEKGLAVLGFPCNQFGGQEPGSEADIKAFCEATYGVKFDMFGKVDVNGDAASPLFKYLTSAEAPVEDKGPVKWNFEKFVIGKDGQLIGRYRSKTTPEDLEAVIAAALAK